MYLVYIYTYIGLGIYKIIILNNYRYFIKWNNCCRQNDRFKKANTDWLKTVVIFPDSVYKNTYTRNDKNTRVEKSCGRPGLSFDDSSDRSKRRKCKNLYDASCLNELCQTTTLALRKHKNEDDAKLLREITHTTPTRGKKIRETWKNQQLQNGPTSLSTDEALSLIISSSLSKSQYNLLRKSAKHHNFDLYPSYHKIIAAKTETYPNDLTITDEKCEVNSNLCTIFLNYILSYE